MAYDEGVAQRVREALADAPDVVEKQMFGGLAFMVRGDMSCGVVDSELMVRVGPEAYDEALAQPHARVMDFTGKPLSGMVYVASAGLAEDEDLAAWVARGVAYAQSLPPK